MFSNKNFIYYDKNYQIALLSNGHNADCPVVFRNEGVNSDRFIPGTYIITLEADGKRIATEKLIKK